MVAGYEPKDREQAKPRTGGGSAPTGKGRGWLDLSGGIADQDRAVTPGPDGMPTQLRPQGPGGETTAAGCGELDGSRDAVLVQSYFELAKAEAESVVKTLGAIEGLLDNSLQADGAAASGAKQLQDARKGHVESQAPGLLDTLGMVVDLSQAFKSVATGLHTLVKGAEVSTSAKRRLAKLGAGIELAGGTKGLAEQAGKALLAPDTVTAMVDALDAKVNAVQARAAGLEDATFSLALIQLTTGNKRLSVQVKTAARLFLTTDPSSPGFQNALCIMRDMVRLVEDTARLLDTRATALMSIVRARHHGSAAALVRGSGGRKAIDMLLESDHSRATLYAHRSLEVDVSGPNPVESSHATCFVLSGLSPELHEAMQALAARELDTLLKHREVHEGLPVREDVGRVLEQIPTLKKVVAGPLLVTVKGSKKTLTVPAGHWYSHRANVTERVNDDGDRAALNHR